MSSQSNRHLKDFKKSCNENDVIFTIKNIKTSTDDIQKQEADDNDNWNENKSNKKQVSNNAEKQQEVVLKNREIECNQKNEKMDILSYRDLEAKFENNTSTQKNVSQITPNVSATTAHKSKAMKLLHKHTPRFQNFPLFIPPARMSYSSSFPLHNQYCEPKAKNVCAEEILCINPLTNEIYNNSSDIYRQDTSLSNSMQQIYYENGTANDAQIFPNSLNVYSYSCYPCSFSYVMEDMKGYEVNYSDNSLNFPISCTSAIDYSIAPVASNNGTCKLSQYQQQEFCATKRANNSTTGQQNYNFRDKYTFPVITSVDAPYNYSSNDIHSLESFSLPNVNSKAELYKYSTEPIVKKLSFYYSNSQANADKDLNMWNSVALNNQVLCLYDTNACKDEKNTTSMYNATNLFMNSQNKISISDSDNITLHDRQKLVDGKQSNFFDKVFVNGYQIPHLSFGKYENSTQGQYNNVYSNSESVETAWNHVDENCLAPNSNGIIDSDFSFCSTKAVSVLQSPPSTATVTTTGGYDIPNFSSTLSIPTSNTLQSPNYINSNNSPLKHNFLKQNIYNDKFQLQGKNQQNYTTLQQRESFFLSLKSDQCYNNLFKTKEQQFNRIDKQRNRNKNHIKNNYFNYKESNLKNRQNNQNFYNFEQQKLYNNCVPPFHELQQR